MKVGVGGKSGSFVSPVGNAAKASMATKAASAVKRIGEGMKGR